MQRILPNIAESVPAADGMSSGPTSTFPQLTGGLWINWLLATTAGEIAGQALNHIYLHRSGRVIVAVMLCFLATLIWQGAAKRLLRGTFWSAAFLLSILATVLAEATDTSMGVGDIGAILLIAILLMFSFVICYRLTGNLPVPTEGPKICGFFWATAVLAQTIASACADWIIEPGGPGIRLAVVAIALGVSATIGLYLCTRISRSALFWLAFVLLGTGAALGGHVAAKSVECSARSGPRCQPNSDMRWLG